MKIQSIFSYQLSLLKKNLSINYKTIKNENIYCADLFGADFKLHNHSYVFEDELEDFIRNKPFTIILYNTYYNEDINFLNNDNVIYIEVQ